MTHLDDGILRRSCDEADSLDDDQRAHLQSCAACAARLSAIRADAAFAAGALHSTAADSDFSSSSLQVRQAWSRVRERAGNPRRRIAYGPWLAAAAAAAAIVGIFVFTPVGTLAQSFLTIFEPQQFVAVPVSRADLGSLPDLQRFGTVVARSTPKMREVTGPAQAAALTHLRVEVPHWLPADVPHTARYAVTSGSDTAFTFSASKAWANTSPQARSATVMPRSLDGAVLEVATHPAVIIAFGTNLPPLRSPSRVEDSPRHSDDDEGPRGHLPPLVIVQAPVPNVTSTGATVAQIEDYLLREPGVSPTLAAEIRAIGDPETTMPIPIPIDRAFGQRVTVQGAGGLGIGDNTGVGGVVVWQRGGIIFAVAGQLRQRDILAVAESLR
jgi:anti-sigma factor RsiW